MVRSDVYQAPMKGSLEADVAVIGGGIAGAAAVWGLSARTSVVLVEAESGVGYHSTGRSAAILTESYGAPLVRMLASMSRSILALEFSELRGVLTERGVLWVASPGQQARLDLSAEIASQGSARMDRLSGDEARLACPVLREEACVGALYEAAATSIDVDLLQQEFLRRARSHGAAVMIGCRIERIVKERTGWRLESAGGTVRAAQIVNAAGAWADGIAALAGIPPMGLMPLRRTAFLFPAPEGNGHHHWPLVIDVDETVYFEPHGPVLMGSNCDEHPDLPHDVRAADIDVAEAIDKINNLTTLGVRRVLKQWAGLRTFCPDRLPVIGPDPNEPTFHWNAGLGGYGIMTAPALGTVIGDLVLGDLSSQATHLVAGEAAATRSTLRRP